MYHFSKVLIIVALLCTLISCGFLPSSTSTIVPMVIIDSNIYTTEIQGHIS